MTAESWTDDVMALGSELAEATDALNESLVRAETALASLNLGVSGAYDVTGMWDGGRDDVRHGIRWEKMDGRWGFVYMRVNSSSTLGSPPSVARTRVLEASKKVRHIAARALPELVAEILYVAKRERDAACELRAGVDATLAKLEDAKRGGVR